MNKKLFAQILAGLLEVLMVLSLLPLLVTA